mmetsp:Transcript_29661/g.52930  ORF Transcript_29661/g.52930 Transcript_29661/m.52930 type:complete len:803 (-) Transcript_29661:34-2442(-)
MFKDVRAYFNHDSYQYNTPTENFDFMATYCFEDCITCLNLEQCSYCRDGLFLNAGKCSACNVTCKTCSSGSVNDCIECALGFYRNPDNTCKLTCPDTYYKGATDCIPCVTPCGNCTGASICTSCTSSLVLNPDSTCQTDCPAGYTQDLQNICQLCINNCDVCPDLNTCSACTNGFVLNPNLQCGLGCPIGYYKLGGVCAACIANCEVCSNSYGCEKCLSSHVMSIEFTCIDSCPLGFYVDDSAKCAECHPDCLSCTGSSAVDCTICASENAQADSRGCICDAGFYSSEESDRISCTACNPSCLTCTGSSATNCLTCIDEFAQVIDGECLCLYGFYDAESSDMLSCFPCHPTCSECFGPTSEECLACNELTELVGGKCECNANLFDSDPSELMSCTNCPYESSKVSEGVCVCEEGFFDADSSDDLVCVSCSAPYAEVAFDECICIEGYYDSDSSEGLFCVMDCLSAKFKDNSSCTTTQNKPASLAYIEASYTSSAEVVLVGSYLVGSPDVFVEMFMTVELLTYLPLISMPMTHDQVQMLRGASQANKVGNFIEGFECFPPRQANNCFSCSNLLRTAQKELSMMAMLGFVEALRVYAKGLKQRAEMLSMVQRRIEMMVFYSLTVKVIVFVKNSNSTNFQTLVSFVAAGCSATWYAFEIGKVLKSPQPTSNMLKPNKLSQLYFALFAAHRLAFALMLVLSSSPKLQTALLGLGTLCFTAYLVNVRPFKEMKYNLHQGFLHLVTSLFISYLFLVNYGVLDGSNLTSAIVTSILSLLAGSSLVVTMNVARTVWELLKLEDNSLVTTL